MGFVFESPHELGNGRVDDEGVPEVDVVADKEARPVSIEPWRLVNLEANPGYPQDIPEEPALGLVVSSWVDDCSHQDQGAADRKEEENAEEPAEQGSTGIVGFLEDREALPAACWMPANVRLDLSHGGLSRDARPG